MKRKSTLAFGQPFRMPSCPSCRSFESCSNRLPSSSGGGVAATSRKSSEATFKWSGRGGVAKKFLDHITPSARTNEASRLFLPPPLTAEEGSSPGTRTRACPQTPFAIWTCAGSESCHFTAIKPIVGSSITNKETDSHQGSVKFTVTVVITGKTNGL